MLIYLELLKQNKSFIRIEQTWLQIVSFSRPHRPIQKTEMKILALVLLQIVPAPKSSPIFQSVRPSTLPAH